MAEVAANAAYSAGAVAWLQKPVSSESLEAAWARILGPIPAAPGLEDLDELYPDRVQIEEDTGPMAAPLPLPLPGQLPPLTSLPPLGGLPVIAPVVPATKSKGKGRLFLLTLLALVAGGLGYAYQQGLLPI